MTSAPQIHAQCLDLLASALSPGGRALDVGSGSGYITTCLALLAGPAGQVVGVELVPELAMWSLENIAACMPELLDAGRVQIVAGNALSGQEVGLQGPFDVIHVGAAIDEVPQELLVMLKPGGRMVLPYGPRWASQVLLAVDKDETGACHQWGVAEVGCVPLLRPNEMEDGFQG